MEKQEESSARTRRAKIACGACRIRKVRCDVTQRSAPCTNCFLDHKECIIKATARHSRRKNAEPRKKRGIAPPESALTPTQQEVVSLETTTRDRMENTVLTTVSNIGAAERYTSSMHSQESVPASTPPALLSLLQNYNSGGVNQGLAATRPGIGDISFSVYQFIRSEFLFTLQQDDIKYLDDQACLQVPRRHLMDEMIDQYFRHIHPILPLFNEGEFWAMYHPLKYASMGPCNRSMSLFVLQAMLFASCSFVPVKKLQRLGFDSARHCRKSLYHRAKLLYWVGIDCDQVSMAQGALLLSLWCPGDNNQQINTWWLSSAIQHARTAQAHCYERQQHLPHATQLELKRLWSTCIIRDRVMGLALRQPILITPDGLDFETYKLTMNDLKAEGEGPSVYETELKRVLLLITVSLSDLCTVLTNILVLVSRQHSSAPLLSEQRLNPFGEVKGLRESLRGWYRDLTYHLSLVQMDHHSNGSVIMFSTLLRMYFHSALIMVANYEIQLEIELRQSQCQIEVNINRNKQVVQESTMSITELLRDLIRLDLVKYLPTSAVTCTAQPLVLYLLDQTLAHGVTTAFQGKLAVVLEAMKVYQCMYDSTDLVLHTAHRISLEARSLVRDREIMGWADVLSRTPKVYLRLIITMDMALAKGSFPGDSEFPSALQHDGNPLRGAVLARNAVGGDEDEDETDQVTGYRQPIIASTPSSPQRTYHGALVMRDTEYTDNVQAGAEPVPGKSWSGFGNREPLLMEADIFLQNLLESYITDGAADGMGSLWPDDIVRTAPWDGDLTHE
ncbi:hypothetical protein BDW59DRAFT_163197 [Aspergillus cavernicola]|uniref:Zn(2)-C6 fungal-type domain-containing protein n=1 Tax=Aspergillus cavernicola TaxID=176166 RepID=A0ABR4I8Q5_9EURO